MKDGWQTLNYVHDPQTDTWRKKEAQADGLAAQLQSLRLQGERDRQALRAAFEAADAHPERKSSAEDVQKEQSLARFGPGRRAMVYGRLRTTAERW
ncbi:hypothetical protein JCM10213_001033 [Rhodosporidiobolus nylandii]